MSDSDAARSDILSTLDYIIDKVQHLRKIMLGVSLSAVVLGPFAIVLSIYLLTHPTFFLLLEQENEFGLYLSGLLAGIIVVSITWLITGLRQYFSLSNWNNRYCGYLRKKEDLDSSISKDFKLDEK